MREFDEFARLLLHFNKTHNVSALKTKDEILTNIYDSLYPLDFFKFDAKVAIDIGSGAGFPAIFLALKTQNTIWHLFEPKNKKAAFLHLVKSELGLKNIEIHNARIEQEEPFKADFISSRAVSQIDILLKLCINYIYKDTKILLYKGSNVQKELENLKNYSIIQNNNRNYILIEGQ